MFPLNSWLQKEIVVEYSVPDARTSKASHLTYILVIGCTQVNK